MADGKPYVTEVDLRHSLVPDEVIERLVGMVPESQCAVEAKEDRGLRKFDYVAFMEGLLCGEQDGDKQQNGHTNGNGALRDLPNGGNQQKMGAVSGKLR